MNWLEYSKCVLEKVRFDRALFRKELRKFLGWLTPAERLHLLRWCRQSHRQLMGNSLVVA
ncbi:hypothetical protein [Rudanella lutea]|uniref:hypothetical protein n=1 Tax=Rudanella lutea TaxID=451374 RepID=UPI000378804C|nr:hypothetical protein [Rudanella lutea]